MLEKLNERIKDRDVSLGVVMIVAGILVWFGLAKFTGLGLVVYGLVQTFWKKEEKFIEEHHHHHHHNNKPRKKAAPRKKNG
jgi:hypothetical protein